MSLYKNLINNKTNLALKFDNETSKYKLSSDSCANRKDIFYVQYKLEQFITSIIDFNYSNTTHEVCSINYKTRQPLDIYHVNGKCDNLSAVFGYTNTKQIKVNREAFKFEKRTQRI